MIIYWSGDWSGALYIHTYIQIITISYRIALFCIDQTIILHHVSEFGYLFVYLFGMINLILIVGEFILLPLRIIVRGGIREVSLRCRTVIV